MRTKIDNRIFYKRLWTLAFPIAFQSLMLAMVAAFDALMLGRVAQEEMTAVSLATQIQFVQNMFLMSGTAAGSILGAQYFGKGDRRTIEEIFNLMLRFCGLISVLFFLACEFIPGLLMHAFSHDPVLIRIGSAYLRIAGWSYLLTGVSQCYLAVMKFTDHVSPVAWISSSAVIANIILNAVFIFGLLGAPRMNARGAALPEWPAAASKGLHQAVSALAGSFALLGCWLYFVHGDYGSYGIRRRSRQCGGVRGARSGLLRLQRHRQRGRYHGRQRTRCR